MIKTRIALFQEGNEKDNEKAKVMQIKKAKEGMSYLY